MAAPQQEEQIKLVTIGDTGVGKSWLLLRWSTGTNKFTKHQSMPTVGIDFKMKNVEIDGKHVKVQVWDTAGQERFRTITQSYYRSSQGILLVYDITNKSTFDSIRTWISQIQMHAEPNINKILVGNKCDLHSQRAVSYEQGEMLAREFGMQFLETSAMTDVNVNEAFMTLAVDVKRRLESNTGPSQPGAPGETRAWRGSGGKTLTNASNVKPKKSWC